MNQSLHKYISSKNQGKKKKTEMQLHWKNGFSEAWSIWMEQGILLYGKKHEAFKISPVITNWLGQEKCI